MIAQDRSCYRLTDNNYGRIIDYGEPTSYWAFPINLGIYSISRVWLYYSSRMLITKINHEFYATKYSSASTHKSFCFPCLASKTWRLIQSWLTFIDAIPCPLAMMTIIGISLHKYRERDREKNGPAYSALTNWRCNHRNKFFSDTKRYLQLPSRHCRPILPAPYPSLQLISRHPRERRGSWRDTRETSRRRD